MATTTLEARPAVRGGRPPFPSAHVCHWPLAAALVITVALGVPMLLFPLGPDQSIFAYIAHRISIGGFPYVDAWDQKPPAIFLLYVIALHIPAPLMRNVRIFDLGMVCLTVIAIYLLAQELWSPLAGGLAAAAYGTAYATLYGYWYTAQPDGYCGLPLCLATWLYYRFLAGRRIWPYVTAGLLTGFAFQLRYPSALIGLAWLYIEWNHARSSTTCRWTAAFRRIVSFSAGFGLMQAAFVGYLLAGHALSAYVAAEFSFAAHYVRLGGPYSPNGFEWGLYLDAARMATVEFLSAHLFIALPAGLALTHALRRDGDVRVREIAFIALTAALGVLLQAKFFWYHWLAILPFLALLGGKGLADAARVFGRNSRLTALGGLAGTVLVLLLLSPQATDAAVRQWKGVGDYYAGPARRERFNSQFGAYGSEPYSYLADDQVARYLQARTAPGDTIYVYGYDPLVYLISERESASRFIYVFPVITPWVPANWRSEFYRDLQTKAPHYILIQADQGAPWIDGLHVDTATYAAHDAELQRILTNRYELDTEIEFFTLYRLRD